MILKISIANKGKKLSKVTCLKMSKSRIGINLGKKHSKKTLLKQRNSAIKRIEIAEFNGEPLIPNIGTNETQILDKLEQILEYKIHRQYRCNGYFIDGYCSNLNLAIEIDENHHLRQIERDIEREKNIKKELDCNFLRIKDY